MDEMRKVCASSVDVGLGAVASAVIAGTGVKVGAVVADGSGVCATVGLAVALAQAARRTMSIGKIFFMRRFP